VRPSRDQTLSVAFHEAGHAVIGYRVGQRFGWRQHYVHIIPEGTSSGASKVARLRPETPAEWRAELYMVAGGLHAQFEHNGDQDGCEGDYEQVDKCLRHVPKSRNFYDRRVLRMVRADWPAIEAVAKALVRRRYLSGLDFERIMRRVDKRKVMETEAQALKDGLEVSRRGARRQAR
jgi:hypothetical protein